MRQDWVTQISDSYSKWIEAAAVSKHFPQSMLSLNNRHQIHLDFVTATDFLGKTYRAYEDLIMADPANCHAHLANCDKDLERVRKCFRHIETFAISDNHYRSVSGLPLHHTQNVNPARQLWNKKAWSTSLLWQILK